MNEEFNEFLADKNHIKVLIGNLLILIIFLMLLMISKVKHNNPIVFYVLMAAIIMMIMHLFIDISISYYLDKVKKVPDLAISDSEIVFFYGTFKRKKTMKISDIESVDVPKWDQYIELIVKNKIKLNLSLKGYSEESKTELRSIFNKIKIKVQGEEDNLNKSTYFLANGKNYIKKQL